MFPFEDSAQHDGAASILALQDFVISCAQPLPSPPNVVLPYVGGEIIIVTADLAKGSISTLRGA